MRLAFVTATVVVFALAGMTGFTQAQNDSCKNACDCENILCIDFCASSCTGTCGKKFNQVVKTCRLACKQCRALQKLKKPSPN